VPEPPHHYLVTARTLLVFAKPERPGVKKGSGEIL